jgi:hypothetical protein
VDQALGPAEQPLFLQLVQQAQVPFGDAVDQAVHVLGPVDQAEQGPFHPHPGADGVPQGQVGIGPPGFDLQQSVEEVVGHLQAALGLGWVVADPGHLDPL